MFRIISIKNCTFLFSTSCAKRGKMSLQKRRQFNRMNFKIYGLDVKKHYDRKQQLLDWKPGTKVLMGKSSFF
jgi:hypothetical protein